MDQRAGRKYRVTRRQDIDRLFREGRRTCDERLTLLARPNGLEHSRLVVAVASRYGPASRRNRAKRLCREAFRLTREDLPGGRDYAMIPRPGKVTTLEALCEGLRGLAPRLEAACKE